MTSDQSAGAFCEIVIAAEVVKHVSNKEIDYIMMKSRNE